MYSVTRTYIGISITCARAMKILLVEDEKEIINFLRPSLEAEHFVVDVAEDGERGSFLGRTNDYDLIILDNNLPKKIGLEVCKEIREAGKATPVIVLSVKSEITTKVELLDAGADDYLSKPFSLDELLARIRALLRRPKGLKGDVLQVDDLVLDSKKQTVFRGEKEINLTRKEFMLLNYLMRSGGAVLSRGMIMEHVWDMHADPFSNTIESHIVSLRRKIDIEGKKKLIHTVLGRGYRMDG
jgi:DNA-binding response OmpR family regulator